MKKFFLAMLAIAMLVLIPATPTVEATNPKVVKLTTSNLLILRDEVSDESVSGLISELMSMSGNVVTLYINSPGGSIIAGNQLINAINASGKTVVCVADFAASMAFSILQSCHVRYALAGSIIMQHQASYSAKGSVTQIRTQVELVEKIVDKLNTEDAKRLGMPKEEFKAKIHDDWWMFDSEITRFNAADQLVLATCSQELMKKRNVQTINSMFGSIQLEWSGCPLITYPVSVAMAKSDTATKEEFKTWVDSLDLDKDWKSSKTVSRN